MSWFQQLKQVFSGRRGEKRAARPARERSDDEIAAIPDVVARATAHYNRAIAYHVEDGDLDRAIVQYSAMLQLVPNFVKAYVNRGVCFLGRKTPDHAAAIADFDRACALLPEGSERAMGGYANRANAHELAGDLDSALEDYTRAVEMARFDGAQERIERVRGKIAARGAQPERRTRSARSLEAEGWRHKADGDSIGALAAFHKAVDFEASPDALYGRGVMNCILRRYPEAIADLTLAIELHPRFPAALTERGLAYVKLGEIDRGIADYDAALGIDPAEPVAYINKGSALCLQDRWTDGLRVLDLALRLDPEHPDAIYNRAGARETLGESAGAARDLEAYLMRVTTGPNVAHAQKRLDKLRARIGRAAEPESASPELWTEVVTIGIDATVTELAQAVRDRGAFFVIVELGEGRRSVVRVYGRTGLRQRLTRIADRIGDKILPLRLAQLHDLWPVCTAVEPSTDRAVAWRRVFESGGQTALQDGDRTVGVLCMSQRLVGDYPRLPTALFGPRPVFDRRDHGRDAQRCPACAAEIAYFDPVLRDGMLDDYACPRCGASPLPRWVEQRLAAGAWSRHGFLGDGEGLEQRIAADRRTLERLGLSHHQIADALGQLIDAASLAWRDRIAEATVRFEDALRRSGERGVEGEAILPLEPLLDDVEQRLRRGDLPAPDQGVSIGRHQVFLQVHLGYQACPWMAMHRPWSDEPTPLPIIVHRVGNFVHHTAKTGCELPCRAGRTYAHGERDFLILDRDTGQYVRGSGMIVHLIRDHEFFEGEGCRYRLDPERATRVLGLRAAPISAARARQSRSEQPKPAS